MSVLLGLRQVEYLHLEDNPNLTTAQIAKLQIALYPKCKISHNAKK